ncbi:ribonuclease D [Pararhodospirillum oryzae]|uniref:3'-5' exonuclease n=1 Tax=Pararhodospirillum oryzae TaxID=478448 RepID=A0A512H7Z8_9PROT|nr:ribonuclease D [Pararhodospirillum oryzae]GEO81548.1 3'-5' exonuclease [Pararhodospirillum oryzae]
MSPAPTIHLHKGDLPEGLSFPNGIAVDTETMGLRVSRDRLCVVQVSGGDNTAHVVQILPGEDAPVLRSILGSHGVQKIMHYGRFDIATLQYWLGVLCEPVYCTKIASKLCRTSAESHSLKTLCKELLGIELSKQQQTSDWGAPELSAEQISYAASDVLYLHALKERLDALLVREGRTALAAGCFRFLPTRSLLDLSGWDDPDLFAH